jgi:hypothetical protein
MKAEFHGDMTPVIGMASGVSRSTVDWADWAK